MSRIFYIHENATQLIAGAIGQPGEREFFLQIVSIDKVNTLACDKYQVLALATRASEILEQLKRSGEINVLDLNLNFSGENPGLLFPVEEDFQIGLMSISFSSERKFLILEIQALQDEATQTMYSDEQLEIMEDAPDFLRANFSISAIRAFINQAKILVAQGRKPCPFCGLPISNEGHLCPRANGYRR